MWLRALASTVSISALLWVATARGVLEGQSQTVDFSYQIPASITLHEPVVATVTIENRSLRSVTVDLGDHHVGQFEFTLTPPSGRIASVQPPPREGLSAGPVVSIDAGQRHVES